MRWWMDLRSKEAANWRFCGGNQLCIKSKTHGNPNSCRENQAASGKGPATISPWHWPLLLWWLLPSPSTLLPMLLHWIIMNHGTSHSVSVLDHFGPLSYLLWPTTPQNRHLLLCFRLINLKSAMIFEISKTKA